MKTIRSVIRSLRHSPLKSFLTLFTVGLGVAVLIFALSISQTFTQKISQELQQSGMILNVANAEFTESGLEAVRPPQFGDNLLTLLKSEISGVINAAPVTSPFWNEFIVNQKQYRIRNVVGTTDEYEKITAMQMVAGHFFTAEDVEKGNKSMIITQSLAEMLYGSAEAAIGEQIKPPAPQIIVNNQNNQTATIQGGGGGGGNNQNRGGGWMGAERFALPTFTITGVYADFSELKRKAYNLADMVIPYTSILPAGMNQEMARRFLQSTTIMSVKDRSLSQVDAQVRAALTREYGDETKVYVWEGTPAGDSNVLEETRQSLNTFALVVNLLGFLLLVTGSIGILSIMLVEILGKGRDIALERAMGAAKSMILKEYFIRSVVITAISVLFGVVISLVFAEPIKSIVLPIFSTLGDLGKTGTIITPLAVLVGAGSALMIGGIFGILPLFATIQTGISEGLREV